MGRYYHSLTSQRGGKFGFGTQDSSDPHGYFGLRECEPSTVTYYATREDDGERVRNRLDEVYDKAKVPVNERVYTFEELCHKCGREYEGEDSEYYSDFSETYSKYFFRSIGEEERKRLAEEAEKKGEMANFFADPVKENGTSVQAFPDAHLWQSRLYLGLVIMSDLADLEDDDEETELECELW